MASQGLRSSAWVPSALNLLSPRTLTSHELHLNGLAGALSLLSANTPLSIEMLTTSLNCWGPARELSSAWPCPAPAQTLIASYPRAGLQPPAVSGVRRAASLSNRGAWNRFRSTCLIMEIGA